MFATNDIPDGTVIVEEDSLVRAICFDVHASAPDDDHLYQDMVNTLKHQLDYMVLQEDRRFIESLEPFDGEEPFLLRVMRKYGLEGYHPDYFHCTSLYRDICRVNHSCDERNAILGNHGEENDWTTGRLVAKRDIKMGEEILIDYGLLGGKVRARMEVFQKYRFICGWSTCRSCSWYYRWGNGEGIRCENLD
jgi:hypothetical protein